jgi:cytochrome c biogenesis protein CcmG, thiol:disulfide interchange protein DsbE
MIARLVNISRFSKRRCGHGLAFSLAVIAAGCNMETSQGTGHASVGKTLSVLDLSGLTGGAKAVKQNDLAGKVVLLNFWGTWCPPCRAEFPHLAALEKKYRDNPDFRLLAVSSAPDIEPNIEELRHDTDSFLKDQGSDLPTYSDNHDATRGEVEKVAGWMGYPTTLILDKQGVIRGKWDGYMPGSERQMESLVAELLAK